MKARGYPVPGVDLMQVATLVHADLSRAGFEARILPLPPPAHGLVVEVRRAGGILQRSMGQGAVLKAWLTHTPQGFTVQIGTDRIGDAAAGAVEWLLATPALMTEGYAAFQQAQVDERIFRVVDHFVSQVSRVPINRTPAKVPEVGPCPMCAAPMPYGARFCPRCAHDTAAPPRVALVACAHCQGAIAPDAAFCPHCGKKAGPEANKSSPAPVAAQKCTGCGAPLDAGAVFCSECGARQTSST